MNTALYLRNAAKLRIKNDSGAWQDCFDNLTEKTSTNIYALDFIQSIFIFPIVFVVLSQLSSIFCFYQKQKHIEFIFFRMLIAHLATYRRAED